MASIDLLEFSSGLLALSELFRSPPTRREINQAAHTLRAACRVRDPRARAQSRRRAGPAFAFNALLVFKGGRGWTKGEIPCLPLPSPFLLSSFHSFPCQGGLKQKAGEGGSLWPWVQGRSRFLPVVVLLPGAWALAMTLPLEQRRASSSSPKSQSTHLPLPQTHVAWGCRLWQFSV